MNFLHLQNKNDLSAPEERRRVFKRSDEGLTVLRSQQSVEDLLHYDRVQFDQFGQSLDDLVLQDKKRAAKGAFKLKPSHSTSQLWGPKELTIYKSYLWSKLSKGSQT